MYRNLRIRTYAKSAQIIGNVTWVQGRYRTYPDHSRRSVDNRDRNSLKSLHPALFFLSQERVRAPGARHQRAMAGLFHGRKVVPTPDP